MGKRLFLSIPCAYTKNKQLQQLVADEGFIIEAMYGNYENELYMPESLRFIIFSRKN